ncbi:MAG: amidase [Rhodospirillum sp.]|nr:amidase [Rhodospirillum sp.]
MAFESAVDLAAAIASGVISPVEAVTAALERIATVTASLDMTVGDLSEEALRDARGAEAAISGGQTLGPLHGVPIAIKDFTPTKGHLTTRGSWATGDWRPEADPVIIQRLKAAGAIIVAKTTTPEFAHSSFTDSPRWGVTRNPWNPERTPGGSSGGSAAIVASGCLPLAEGTDMAGSIRIPAALSGVVGFKPSLGRIPMDILPTSFDSMAHFGPLARTVDDAALFLKVTSGPHPSDILSQRLPTPLSLPIPGDMRGKRLALSVDLGYYDVHPDIARRVREAADVLRHQGAQVDEIPLSWTRRLNDTAMTLWAVALAAAFGEARDRIRDRMDPALVTFMDGVETLGAIDYKRLEGIRAVLWTELTGLFLTYDALLCPTCAQPAPPVEARDSEFMGDTPEGRFAGLDMTCMFNLVGQCPAISVPCGLTSTERLPVGLQIIGPRFADAGVLTIARAVEREITLPKPPLFA